MENNHRLITYVTKELKLKLEEKANEQGLSVSAYLRCKVLEIIKEGE